MYFIFFFFNDTATTEIYTLSLHDALPISSKEWQNAEGQLADFMNKELAGMNLPVLFNTIATKILSNKQPDRKSTRLNSSHLVISYAVFCLKKKKIKKTHHYCNRLLTLVRL